MRKSHKLGPVLLELGWFLGEEWTLFGVELLIIYHHEYNPYLTIFSVTILKFTVSLHVDLPERQ